MANVQQTLETIFMEAAKVFGKEKSKELIEKLSDDKKVEKEEKSKRISRMTPTLANKLKAELVKVGITFSTDEKVEKKELDKFKKDFTSYVEDLTGDDFTAKGLEKHMEDFAKSKQPATTTTTTTAVESTSAVPKKGAKTEKSKKATKKETTTIPSSGPSNVAIIYDLSLEELQAIEMVATPSDGPMGVLWDSDNGRWVRGPQQDDDEDMTEKKFQGKTYAIGDNTGRVYEVTDNKDIFVGYAGVGAFADLKL